MPIPKLVNENRLDEWVSANAVDAQGVVVELVYRLVAASCPRPRERRFPLGDSIGQRGPDGILETDFAFEPFVPMGRSIWEIGTGLDAGKKASSDYRDRVAATGPASRRESTFVFVTPRSGRRATWKHEQQAAWIEERKQRSDWRDVRVLDGTKLIDWLHHFFPVELWLAQQTWDHRIQRLETLDQRWSVLRNFGAPPPLSPRIFLANRDPACSKLNDLFRRSSVELRLETHYPDQVAHFVAAYVAGMDADSRVDAVSRSLIVSDLNEWNALITLRDQHILIADADLDLGGEGGPMLLEKARRAGHAVIYGTPPGGSPHPNSIPIPSPKGFQLQEALEQSGYPEERARNIANRSDGNLSSLLIRVTPQGHPPLNMIIRGRWRRSTTSSIRHRLRRHWRAPVS
jgi:hypothetical protein